MKLLIAISVFCYAVGCKKDISLPVERNLKSVIRDVETYHGLWVNPVLNFDDTARVIAYGAMANPAYDTCTIKKLQVKLQPVNGSVYSVSNDSAMFILTFWGRTKYTYLNHPVFLKLSDRIVQVNF